MIRKLARLIRGDRGSVIVEFALLLPLFCTLVFAIIEFGSAWYSKQMLVNASREGARMGALFEGVSDSEVEVFVNNVLTTAGFPGSVNVTSTGASGGTGTLVTVSINANHDLPVLGNLVPGVPSTMTLNATTVMRHE
jgi:Flp pilus assembly protein TadG